MSTQTPAAPAAPTPIFHLPADNDLQTDANALPEKQPEQSISGSGKEPTIWSHRFRYFILFLGCFCLTSICSNMIALNFTFICMDNPSADRSFTPRPEHENLTSKELQHVKDSYEHRTIPYNPHEKAILMWAVAFGSIAATFPFNLLYAKYGARRVFLAAGILSATATVLIPPFAHIGFWWFVGARVIQGVAYAADFAAIGVLCSRWASLKQNGIFISILTCFSPISSAITNPVSGALCNSSWGWPSVYYFHGAACILLFVAWFAFYTDRPECHRNVSSIELEKIHRDKSEAHKSMDSFIPYLAIIRNPVILTVWLNALADIGCGIFLLTYTPTYMNNVLNYSVGHTGWLGALPALSHIPFKLATGYFSDKNKTFDERKKMIFFNTLALFVPGLMYAGLGYVPDDSPMIAVALFTLIHAFLGANCGGFYKCGTLVSRQYSAFVISNIQFIKCLTLFLAPALVAIFVTDDHSKEQWRTIFMILAATLIISNFVFCFMATDQPAEFTNITRESAKLQKNQKTNGVSDATACTYP
uniref:MFS domain-containing protein n=1 Tax=Panagrellus redivivus TaxID=6233 RepID=A0A7E4V879_PANRE